ncbi:MAG: Mrp/NBP35 family ATP-binding protein [Phycisphaeraceae bacterium]|nr:Mrp/NBP35 family ATP-binding protein [Phycisphaeraceae bacterium]MCB9847192.1 Mrp/NBP35 family ATP-binding protein [Phycisphaeraceae bacterium]
MNKEQAQAAVASVVGAGAVRKVAACDGIVACEVAVKSGADREALTKQLRVALYRAAAEHGVKIERVNATFVEDAAGASAGAPGSAPERSAPPGAVGGAHKQAPAPSALPNVSRIIAVGAGKGGVGKSTVAVNMAVGLARKGRAVGLMDGDIYGPSLPTMLGLGALEPQVHEGMIQPFNVHGVKAVTIGKLVEPEKPLIWRGPMAHGAFKQLIEQTRWGDLDDLVIDLPPGTGDVMLTLAQTLAVDGAVVVCTPQKVAQDDAVRAVRMFQTLGVEVIGVVENMSYFIGDDGKEYDIFGRGGAERMAQRLGVPFLGAVPINMALREHSDSGDPTANFDTNGTSGGTSGGKLREELERVVEQLDKQAALASMRKKDRAPELSIS